MHTLKKEHLDATFVVRVWTDNGPESKSAWRGRIEHLQSGHKFHFQGLEDLGELLFEKLCSKASNEAPCKEKPSN